MASRQVCRAVSWLMIDVGRLSSLWGCVARGSWYLVVKEGRLRKLCVANQQAAVLCAIGFSVCLEFLPWLHSVTDCLQTVS